MEKIEARAVVKFLTLEGTTPAEISKRMDKVYGPTAPSFESIKRWAREFRMGRKSLTDEQRTGRLRTSITSDSIERTRALIMEDRRITI